MNKEELTRWENYARLGQNRLIANNSAEKRRKAYASGKHDLPFAPEGVNQEYLSLRKTAAIPLVRLAVRTPCQRLRVEGFRAGTGADPDESAWAVWEFNSMASRQRGLYADVLTYERGGVVSVWPNQENPETPYINVEDPLSVYVHPNPHNPLEADWAVKVSTGERITDDGKVEDYEEVRLYLSDRVLTFEPKNGSFALVREQSNSLGKVPFVVFKAELDAAGNGVSYVDPLIPQQEAIDALRFDLMLAAQFAAYRQRIVVGFDPVARDGNGDPVVMRDEDGEPVLDANGQMIPIINAPGKAGVDRMMVFPGSDTKVFDIPESDLKNYTVGLNTLIGGFASTAQIPPQYLVSDFSNTSGDLMVATESTLTSLVTDLQTAIGEGWAQVMRLVNLAREGDDLPTQTAWAEARPISLSEVADAASKLAPHGVPIWYFAGLLPGVSERDLMQMKADSLDALTRAAAGDYASLFGPKPDQAETE